VVEILRTNKIIKTYTYLILVFLWIPLFVILSSSFTKTNFISFPPELFSLKWWMKFIATDTYKRSTWLSIRISTIVAPISLIIGLLSSIVLVRYRFKGRNLFKIFFNMPYTIPQVVFALSALLFFTSFGHINIIHFIICHIIITLPFNIKIISASLQLTDPNLEKSARVLGANEITSFYKITLPLIKPGLIGAFLHTFLSSFNNTTIAIFIGTPKLWTLPARIFSEIEFHAYPDLVAAASFSMILSFIFMLLIHKYIGISSLYK